MKRIIIHGALNLTNFGDILFSTLFLRYCESLPNCETFFAEMPVYGLGEFARKENQYRKSISFRDMLNSDLLVYMSGGYFGDSVSSLRLTIRRYLRYVLLGELMRFKGKKIVICGVGGGPIFSSYLRNRIVKLFNYASAISVRDDSTAHYFIDNGVVRDLDVTADTALVITPSMLPALESTLLDDIFLKTRCCKFIFVHLVGGKEDNLMSQIIIPALNQFLYAHPEYSIICGTDGMVDLRGSKSYLGLETTNRVYYYDYSSAWQLAALLNKVDFIVTTKLHVGIVASALSKSVISFPQHPFKTKRFYCQLGEQDRCIMIKEATADVVFNQLEKFHNKPVLVPDSLRARAKRNLTIIHEVIAALD